MYILDLQHYNDGKVKSPPTAAATGVKTQTQQSGQNTVSTPSASNDVRKRGEYQNKGKKE